MTREEAMKVYEVQHERFRQTKELQWKVNLASWALIALGVSGAKDFRESVSNGQLIFAVLTFFVAQMIFSYRTQRALEADKKISRILLTS